MDLISIIKPYKIKNKIKSLFHLPMRLQITGPSGSGKTEVLRSIVLNHWTNYENLYIFTKNIDQPVYNELIEIFEGIPEIYFYISDTDIISVDECERDSLVVFDDIPLDEQKPIYEYMNRSRPKDISVIFLNQCYSSANKQYIRNNLTLLIVFKSTQYIKNIWNDFLSNSITLNNFKTLCSDCWKNDYGFITIDLLNNRFYYKLEKLLDS